MAAYSNTFHGIAFVLFAVALTLYFVGLDGATATIIAGAVFEAAAWAVLFVRGASSESPSNH